VKDFILDISFDARDPALEDLAQSRLYLTPSSGSSSSEANGTITISAYFDDADERDAAARELGEIAAIELHATDRERIDWLDRYQQSLQPLYIGDHFIVAPDATLIPRDTTRHALVVPQEQAFGTGSHETTSLCIEILETLDVAAKRGLDIGSGSGILALAMCRLGANHVIAFDNDVDAFAALRDNRVRNGVDARRMPIFIGGLEALSGGAFDVVTMNIIPEVIIPLLGDVRRRVNGSLILSGILAIKRDDVLRACSEHGLEIAEERTKGEWWAGRFTLRPL
jgi:ribosomal protein L11 methyltransferase